MPVVPILLTVNGSIRRGKEGEVKEMLENTLHREVMADFKPFFQKVLVREFKLKEKPLLRRAATANSVPQWKEEDGEFTYKVKYELQIVDGEPPANAAKVLATEIEYRGVVLSNLDVWRDETLFPDPPVVMLQIAKASATAATTATSPTSKTGSPKSRNNSTRRRSRSRSHSPRSTSDAAPFSWIWNLFSGR